jgi:hypothetical protein
MFYGATDSLLDAGLAAESYSRAISTDTGVNLLVCYGFLQALCVQQDAVRTLSRALGIDWHPNDSAKLKTIRDLRNRLTGHPSLAGEKERPARLSSAILPYHDITKEGFRGHIYYNDGIENVTIEVSSILTENQEALALQALNVERKMDEEERKFRESQKVPPLSAYFEGGFSYLLRRLWCNVEDEACLVQALNHAQMIRERINELHTDLKRRGFGDKATADQVERILVGIGLLEEILNREDRTSATQHEFDLIFGGLEKTINSLVTYVSELDAKLNSSV